MIPVRVEKLRFIAEEMQIALFLAQHLTEPFYARTLARHVLIRAENFIEHARGLRSPLNQAGHRTTEFNTKKEAYAQNFAEYFTEPRHRLSAHVQDLDFGRRIEQWKDIEVSKVSYFVDGAREIYDFLASLNLPGYVPYSAPPELADPGLQQILAALQVSLDNRSGVEMSTDPLAMTRSHTVSMLTFSALQARASQLVLIQRWVDLERDLLTRLAAYPGIARILKERIVTDVVSYCDCLVSRPVAPGALQQMDGLDALLARDGHAADPITDFVTVSNFAAELQAIRPLRDRLGAHTEIDTSETVASLTARFDAVAFADVLAFHDRLRAVFRKVCFSHVVLRMHAADGQRIAGVTANSQPATPFAGTMPVPNAQPALRPPSNDTEEYRANLTRWIDGDDGQRTIARRAFYDDFAGSEEVEEVIEIEDFGVGSRRHRHALRKAHQFILETLERGVTDGDFVQIVELLLACSAGWPYPLAEILVRYGAHANLFRQWGICHALGEGGSYPHASVTAFLEARRNGPSWPMRLRATLALFKLFFKSEGLFRINHRGQTIRDFDEQVAALLAGLSEDQKTVCLLAFASIMTSRRFSAFCKPFEANYAALQARLTQRCSPLIGPENNAQQVETLKQLIGTHDYVGVCLLVATTQQGGEGNPLYALLLDNCCTGNIVAAAHDQANRHLALCFFLKKNLEVALELATGIATRHPDNVAYQILVAQILGEQIGSEASALQKVAEIRRTYRLDADQQALLAKVEAEVAGRDRDSSPNR